MLCVYFAVTVITPNRDIDDIDGITPNCLRQALQHEMIAIDEFRSLVITPTYHLLQALQHEMIEIEEAAEETAAEGRAARQAAARH